jgi:hypothetical protein
MYSAMELKILPGWNAESFLDQIYNEKFIPKAIGIFIGHRSFGSQNPC